MALFCIFEFIILDDALFIWSPIVHGLPSLPGVDFSFKHSCTWASKLPVICPSSFAETALLSVTEFPCFFKIVTYILVGFLSDHRVSLHIQPFAEMEDIAVIGVGLRFPGDARNPDDLWTVLENGESQWSEIPKDRLNIDGFYHPGGDRQGSVGASQRFATCR